MDQLKMPCLWTFNQVFERFIFLGLWPEVLHIYFYASICLTSWGNCIALNIFPGMKGPSGTHLSNYAPPSLSSGPRVKGRSFKCDDRPCPTDIRGFEARTSCDCLPLQLPPPPRDAGRDRGQLHREGEPLERAPMEVPAGSFCLPFKAEGRYSWPSLQLGEP